MKILLGGLIEQVRGVSYKPEDVREELDENSVILLRANNIRDEKLNFDDVVYIDKNKVSEKQYLHAGDIFLCVSSGSKELVGKAAYVKNDLPMVFGAFCKVVRPRVECPQYIGHYFASPYYRAKISESSAGANINNIRNEHIDNLQVEFPPLPEQQHIAAVLDQVSELVSLRRQQLTKLDELVKARFVEMFGDESNPLKWSVVTVEDVADVQVGVVIKPAQYYTDAENGVKTFRSLNIGPMYIKDTEWVYFSEEGNKKNQKSILKENDLLIVRSGAPGTACVVTPEYAGCNAVDIIIAHPDLAKINPYYLCQYTNLPHGKRQIDEGTGGAAQQHFNVGKYNKLQLMLPPLDKQNEFEQFLKRLDKSKATIQQSLEKLELLKKSLMQEYFG